jgi:hypothetical protein
MIPTGFSPQSVRFFCNTQIIYTPFLDDWDNYTKSNKKEMPKLAPWDDHGRLFTKLDVIWVIGDFLHLHYTEDMSLRKIKSNKYEQKVSFVVQDFIWMMDCLNTNIEV